jgi:hypothetical protein
MRSGRVGGMSAEVTLNYVCAVRASSNRLPYMPQVMTQMVGIKCILECVG